MFAMMCNSYKFTQPFDVLTLPLRSEKIKETGWKPTSFPAPAKNLVRETISKNSQTSWFLVYLKMLSVTKDMYGINSGQQ